jgi:hypothetical protein
MFQTSYGFFVFARLLNPPANWIFLRAAKFLHMFRFAGITTTPHELLGWKDYFYHYHKSVKWGAAKGPPLETRWDHFV